MLRLALLIATLVGILLFAMPATAQGVCGDRADILKKLFDKFGEMIQYRALDASGVMIEVVVNKASESWTMVATKPRQQTCVIGSGQAWRGLVPEPQGPET